MSAPATRPLSVDSLLGPGGALEEALPAYEHRPEQLQMARAVERAFSEGSYLLAEAGTGTGKTLAYLVPALLAGRKVVVSTATKTLQDQVFFKDLPLLSEKLGLRFEAAYLKGRGNYLCLHRYESFEKDPQFVSREEAKQWPLLKKWVTQTETGDRAELDLPESFAAWSRLSTTSETCLGSRCSQYDTCFVTRMRKRAEAADLLVVNHHLFFADLALRSSGKRTEGVLPFYDAVIFDEAHALEDAASGHFGCSVSNYRLEELSRDAVAALQAKDERHATLSALAQRVRSHADALFLQAPRALGMSSQESTVALRPETMGKLSGALEQVREGLAALASFAGSEREPELAAIHRRAEEMAEQLSFLEKSESADHVYWAEARGKGLFLRASPIDVAKELRDRLYGALDTVVFTSATLAADSRFDFFAKRMGMYDDEGQPVTRVRTLAVPSPFDFPRQSALYLPTHLPDPSAPGFIEAAAEEIIQLCEVTGGRAFVLFTSLRNMVRAYELTATRLPYQALLQGERPKQQLLDAFRQTPSVLFAAHSFWEGVDVPGDALSLVIIDRLPFASPGDPLVAARIRQIQARGEEPFDQYQLPQAALALRQGFGRLIRTQADRGIVAMLDRRIVTKGYGRVFLSSLPPAKRMEDTTELSRWFNGPVRPVPPVRLIR
ncbi:ATP-dependent DNA helicase [Corallococcus exiguus]|uniref:ATP-dependent DNA helicase n=1 Tax=Corallococcus TaxID=83461 RepID=UPI000ED8D9C6|nr:MULTISPECIES: ATP-dependent DNA helicase [Corallococcus]NNB89417.1 ATP-dependent DNA helicase [Corallococcus exiguus]NNB98527.1 ATP-dependent DNA helicase [Corallococcus exiguus]NNC05952.1 ATP-dependent DNA helicase [Corallococcus exiguus]NPC49586.1 ATP-dependent DNA helicase [Corallococcus exiguus]NRD62424.1 ATP-dependent DNA helicase [Corallococcus exiguus]